MGLADDRKSMERALKDVVVPVLRDLGFRGSYPHFHRMRDGHVDLFAIQFNRHGGSFAAEIAYVGPDWQNLMFEKRRGTEPKALQVGDAANRLRLGCDPSSSDPQRRQDHWLAFSGFSLSALIGDRFVKRAEEVVALIGDQGVPWWDEMRDRVAEEPR